MQQEELACSVIARKGLLLLHVSQLGDYHSGSQAYDGITKRHRRRGWSLPAVCLPGRGG